MFNIKVLCNHLIIHAIHKSFIQSFSPYVEPFYCSLKLSQKLFFSISMFCGKIGCKFFFMNS